MQGRGFPWSKLLMVLLVFAASFIAHDVRTHGSFAGSHSHTPNTRLCLSSTLRPCVCVCVPESSTARHLQRSGVTGVYQQAWGKISVYTKQGFRYDSGPQRGVQVDAADVSVSAAGWRKTLLTITLSV